MSGGGAVEFRNFAPLVEKARRAGPVRIAVAAAEDDDVLLSLREGRGMVEPVLFGDAGKIASAAVRVGLDLGGIEVVDHPDPKKAALEAVRSVREGRAAFLMKGMIQTADFMKAALHPEFGLRSDRLLSHVAVYDAPGYDRMIFLTDGGLNLAPDLNQKREIIQNAVEVAARLGVNTPKVAVLGAVEAVNPSMPATLDAAALAKMAERGQIRGAVVDGPLALDLAVSEEAAAHKGVRSPVAGRADVLLVPNIEVGNALGKAIMYFGGGIMAGRVAGATAPIVLNSRADTAQGKFASLAAAVVYAAAVV